MRTLLLSAGLAALTVAAASPAMAQNAQQEPTELAPVSVLATRTEAAQRAALLERFPEALVNDLGRTV